MNYHSSTREQQQQQEHSDLEQQLQQHQQQNRNNNITGNTSTTSTTADLETTINYNSSNNNINISTPSPSSLQQSIRHSLTWTAIQETTTSGTRPPARSGAASVIVNKKLYMFGGYGGDGTGRLDDFYSFDFETNTWEEVEVLSSGSERNGVGYLKPGCRENNGVVIADGSRFIYLFGGYNGNAWLNDLWTFDIETKCWTCLRESSDGDDNNNNSNITSNHVDNNVGNLGAGDVGIGGGMLGQTNNSNNIHHHHHHRGNNNRSRRHANVLSAAAAVANNSDDRAPSRRFGYISVVHDNKFILWGGFDGSKWLNDMYEFNFATMKWREVRTTGKLPSTRSCPAWCKDDKCVYIQGGYDGMERKSDFYSCDLSTYQWKEMSSKGKTPSPRYFHSCCLYDNKMYCYGGYSGKQRLSDMYCYDFDTEVWSPIDCEHGDCPSGRSSLVAQVYDNDLYVFGGYNGETVLNDFYKFRLKAISVPPSDYLYHMRGLINNKTLSDVTFLVEGKEIYANRAILATRSAYFHALLFGVGMKESVQTCEEAECNLAANERKPIVVEDISHPVFMKMIEYIYTDSLFIKKELLTEVGIPLLIASEKFMLDRLKAICEDKLRKHVNADNVSGILLTSHRHNANGLKDISLDVIMSNLNSPTVMNSLTDLKAEPDLLIEIIKRKATLKEHASGTNEAHSNKFSGPFGQASEMWNGSQR